MSSCSKNRNDRDLAGISATSVEPVLLGCAEQTETSMPEPEREEAYTEEMQFFGHLPRRHSSFEIGDGGKADSVELENEAMVAQPLRGNELPVGHPWLKLFPWFQNKAGGLNAPRENDCPGQGSSGNPQQDVVEIEGSHRHPESDSVAIESGGQSSPVGDGLVKARVWSRSAGCWVNAVITNSLLPNDSKQPGLVATYVLKDFGLCRKHLQVDSPCLEFKKNGRCVGTAKKEEFDPESCWPDWQRGQHWFAQGRQGSCLTYSTMCAIGAKLETRKSGIELDVQRAVDSFLQLHPEMTIESSPPSWQTCFNADYDRGLSLELQKPRGSRVRLSMRYLSELRNFSHAVRFVSRDMVLTTISPHGSFHAMVASHVERGYIVCLDSSTPGGRDPRQYVGEHTYPDAFYLAETIDLDNISLSPSLTSGNDRQQPYDHHDGNRLGPRPNFYPGRQPDFFLGPRPPFPFDTHPHFHLGPQPPFHFDPHPDFYPGHGGDLEPDWAPHPDHPFESSFESSPVISNCVVVVCCVVVLGLLLWFVISVSQ